MLTSLYLITKQYFTEFLPANCCCLSACVPLPPLPPGSWGPQALLLPVMGGGPWEQGQLPGLWEPGHCRLCDRGVQGGPAWWEAADCQVLCGPCLRLHSSGHLLWGCCIPSCPAWLRLPPVCHRVQIIMEKAPKLSQKSGGSKIPIKPQTFGLILFIYQSYSFIILSLLFLCVRAES